MVSNTPEAEMGHGGFRVDFGAWGWVRTSDLSIISRMLHLLSYPSEQVGGLSYPSELTSFGNKHG